MVPLEERFFQLKADIVDLQGTADVSEIGYQKAKEIVGALISKLKADDEEGKKVYLEGARKYLDAELDYLRDKVSIIRKVSPRTANHLETMINDYDKGTRHILEMVFDKDYDVNSVLHAVAELYNFVKTVYLFFELRNIVNMICNSFLDAITYLDGEKSPK